MKKSFFIVCTMLSIIGCGNVAVQDVPVVDDDDAVEVAFEDVTTDVRIVPLISDDPIGACKELHCYGNEVLMSDQNSEYIYYFVDGKLKSTLHAVGRGPGEYTSIAHFTYSPTKKLILVSAVGDVDEFMGSANSMVMKYSVPDMKYVGKISVEGKLSVMSCQDGDKILSVGTPLQLSLESFDENSVDTCRIILSDIETGETIRKIADVSYYDFLQSDILQSKGKNLSNNVCIGGYVNKLFHYEGNKQELVFAFTFGKKNIPQKHFELDQPTSKAIMDLLEFMMSEPAKDCLEGGFWPMVDGNRYSFWYHKALEHYRDHYFRYENSETVNYCGFRAKGTNIPLLPKSVDDDTYVAIVEGSPESLFAFSNDRSTFSADLEKVMKSQTLNNPVLIYYKIK